MVANATGRIAVLQGGVDIDILMPYRTGTGPALGQTEVKLVRRTEQEDVLQRFGLVQDSSEDGLLIRPHAARDAMFVKATTAGDGVALVAGVA